MIFACLILDKFFPPLKIFLATFLTAFLISKSYYLISDTSIVSWIIIVAKSLKTITLYLIAHYGASSLFKLKREYASNMWLYIGVLIFGLYLLENLAWAVALRHVEGFEHTNLLFFGFLKGFIYHSGHNISQFLTFSIFFGLFSKYKKEEYLIKQCRGLINLQVIDAEEIQQCWQHRD